MIYLIVDPELTQYGTLYASPNITHARSAWNTLQKTETHRHLQLIRVESNSIYLLGASPENCPVISDNLPPP
jgi:hypothetical protein